MRSEQKHKLNNDKLSKELRSLKGTKFLKSLGCLGMVVGIVWGFNVAFKNFIPSEWMFPIVAIVGGFIVMEWDFVSETVIGMIQTRTGSGGEPVE